MTPDALFSSWPCAGLILIAVVLSVRVLTPGRRLAAVPAGAKGARKGLLRAVWIASFALLALGHLAGLIAPRPLLLWGRSPARLYLLEAASFGVGLTALAAWIGLSWRQLSRRAGSAAAELCDSAFHSVLLIGLASGLATAAVHRWGWLWGPAILTPYARSLLRGQPEVSAAAGMPFLVQLHVFSAFAAAALFPFTRIAGRLALALRRALALAGARAAGAGRAAQGWARRLNPAPWIWPDED